MTRLDTTPDVFRRTSRTTITLAEAIAGARILLRDAGYPDAEHLDGHGVTAAVRDIEAEAEAQGVPALSYLRGAAADRMAAMHAPNCGPCGSGRPLSQTWAASLWRVRDGHPICPDCMQQAEVG